MTYRIMLTALLALLVSAPFVLAEEVKPKKIVLIAGKIQSHPPGCHEHEKDMALLKHCLDNSPNVSGVTTELHLNGWPEDPSTLDDADMIMIVGDGADRKETAHTLLRDDHMAVVKKQMDRGCGLFIWHYATIIPSAKGGQECLEWIGGFFDYQNGPDGGWYSKIKHATALVTPATPGHPVCRGLTPFELGEEYYYNIRFRENDPRLTPIFSVPIPGEPEPQVVGWVVQRANGGRGGGFTGGHFPENMNVENYRKMLLNAILWTAGAEVPAGGVISTVPGKEPAAEKPIKALILTGHHHPGHPWQPSTVALRDVLSVDERFLVDVTTDPEFLADPLLSDYDLIVQNYCNWERPGISDAAKAGFVKFVNSGGGLAIIHFANGAFSSGAHPTDPNDVWPEYAGKMCRRVWIDGQSSHDAYGPFRVEMTDTKHEITEGVRAFNTVDELYFNQQGELPIEPLAVAQSKVSGKDAPMLFAYDYGKGRIFQTMLGHSVESLVNPGAAELARRGCVWAVRREQKPVRQPRERDMSKFSRSLDARKLIGAVEPNGAFATPPLTVECWVKLSLPGQYSVFLGHEPKSSATHWELFSSPPAGTFVAYMPGYTPDHIRSDKVINDDRWHYVAMTFDGKAARLYVDGQEVARSEHTRKEGGQRKEGRLCIGRAYDVLASADDITDPYDSNYGEEVHVPCNGLVDEVRISNVIRPIDAVPEGPFEADEQTIGLWHLDDNPAKLLFEDSSKQQNSAAAEMR